MTRRIVFVRHVSSPKPPGTPDFEREIDESGRRDGRSMAHYLEETHGLPRRVLCSSAKRARQSWEAILEGIEADDEAFDVDFIRELYETDVDGTLEHLWGLPDDVDSVLLVGHNPTWSEAVSHLTGVRTKMLKGAAAVLECEGDRWNEAARHRSCELVEMKRPFELGT